MPAEEILWSRPCRPDTAASRLRAVERLIHAMRDRLGDSLSLQDMAKIALLSPYHLNRVFHEITGVPPSRFLYALRLETARRLLVTTRSSVTDVCYDVGYNSLGTFVSRFSRFVGASPRRIRQLAESSAAPVFKPRLDLNVEEYRWHQRNAWICGRIIGPSSFIGLICVGLFETPIPQGYPISCTLLTKPGAFRLAAVSHTPCYALAAALVWSGEIFKTFMQEPLLRGSSGPLLAGINQSNHCVDVMLRPAQLIDPPLVISVPFLLAQQLSLQGGVTASTLQDIVSEPRNIA
jgi:AraC-like DNA-binding protein